MKINGYRFKFNDCGLWFSDKGNLGAYIISAANVAERQRRLRWLSEGSLRYHMTQFSCAPNCGKEKDMFADFINSLSNKEISHPED